MICHQRQFKRLIISMNHDNANTQGLELKDKFQKVNGNFIETDMPIIQRLMIMIVHIILTI